MAPSTFAAVSGSQRPSILGFFRMLRLHSLACATISVIAALTAIGCDSGPKLVKVSGIVLIDGKPLSHGFVQVLPAGQRACSGKIGPDGRFILTTYEDGDGCYTGKHPAAVIATETLGPGSQKWHAPKAYVDSANSGLIVSVDGPTDDLKIELTWNGGKPFVEYFNKE